MNKIQSAAYVMSQSVCAFAEIEAMKAANVERAGMGEAQAYGEKAFEDVPIRLGLGCNDVLSLLQRAED